MVCPDELTCAMYADGELPGEEARRLRNHMAECHACRQLVAALEEENRALVHALQGLDQPFAETAPHASPFRRRAVLEVGVIVFAAAFIIRLALDYLTGQET